MKPVVTWTFSHLPGRISLCAAHEATEAGLCSVFYGRHPGYCQRCEEAKEAAGQPSYGQD